jgi:hypothetical protein
LVVLMATAVTAPPPQFGLDAGERAAVRRGERAGEKLTEQRAMRVVARHCTSLSSRVSDPRARESGRQRVALENDCSDAVTIAAAADGEDTLRLLLSLERARGW